MDLDERALRNGMAERLGEERVRLQKKPEELAQAAGVHASTLFNYLNGSRLPDALVLAKLHASSIDVLYVITGQRERHTSDLTAEERDMLDRYSALPPKLRTFVENAVLLSSLAYSARQDYDYGQDHQKKTRITFAGRREGQSGAPVAPAVHEPAPPAALLPNEAEHLDLYRRAGEKGRRLIDSVAQHAVKYPAQEVFDPEVARARARSEDPRPVEPTVVFGPSGRRRAGLKQANKK